MISTPGGPTGLSHPSQVKTSAAKRETPLQATPGRAPEEVAIVGPDGVTSFAALQDALSKGGSADLVYYEDQTQTARPFGAASGNCPEDRPTRARG